MSTGRVFVEVSEGAEFELGGKTLEVDRRIPRGEYVSGACFGRGPSVAGPSTPLPRAAGSLLKKFTPLVMNPNPRLPASAQSMGSPAPRGRGVELEAVSLVASDSGSATPSKSAIPDSAWSVHWFVRFLQWIYALWLISNRRKPQSRKHKTWDGDAFVHCSNGMFKLISESGKLCDSLISYPGRTGTDLR
jgi:DNA repair and recombination protein RAD54B